MSYCGSPKGSIFKEVITLDSHKLFSVTSPLKLFFLASIPGAVSMLASALYQTIDGIFVGQYLGATAFAAVNLAMPFVIINFSLADLIGVGSSVPISINLGRKNEREANNYFTCACIMIFTAGILMGGLLFASAPLLIRLMGADGDFARLAVQYIRVYALCSPLTTIIFAMDNFLRICGFIRGSMALNIFMSVLSGLLEFLFLGVFGFGVWGAALATCTGMMVCALIALAPFIRKKALLKFVRPEFHLRMIRQIVICGSPNFLNNIAGRITSIMLNAILVRVGGELAVSIYGVLMYVDGFIQPLLYGMCDSLQPAVGYNYGAGKMSRVRAIEKCCFTASAVVSLLSAVIIYLIPSDISILFMPDAEGAALELAVFALELFEFTYVTRWFPFATQSFMLAIEKSRQAALISVSTALIFPVLLVIILWPVGLTGIWLNFSLTSLLAGIMAAVILIRLKQELLSPDA